VERQGLGEAGGHQTGATVSDTGAGAPAITDEGTHGRGAEVKDQAPGTGLVGHAGEDRTAQIGWRPSTWPAWLQVLAIYAASRLYDFLLLSRIARLQPGTWMNPPNPGYVGFLSMWDGFWYRRIAETGYPSTLPVNAKGLVQLNEWAFYPLYPMSVRGLMRVLGTEWPLTASFLAMACGGLAALVMHSLVRRAAGHQTALWTVTFFVFFPAAAVLQLTYTESMGILILATALWCLQRRQYLLGASTTFLMSLVRPIGVPMAAVVGLHVLMRIVRRRREPVSPSQLLAMITMSAVAAASGFVWPYLVARETGVPDAYAQTMSAWRDIHKIVLLKPWLWEARDVLGEWFGPLVLALVVLLTAWVLTRPVARVIAGDLRNWVICYLGYLVVVLDPSTSLFRYLLLVFPLGTLAAAVSSSRAYRIALLLAFAAAQIVWVTWLWRFIFPVTFPGGPP
jgi:hypothetical protein